MLWRQRHDVKSTTASPGFPCLLPHIFPVSFIDRVTLGGVVWLLITLLTMNHSGFRLA
jgi:hypothetical protein